MTIDKQSLVAVIGSGFGGKGVAATLGLDGYRVRLHDIDAARVEPVQAIGGLRIAKHEKDFTPVELASTDLAKVVDGASVIVVSTYGNDHEAVAKSLAPLLRDGQIIILMQGHFLGSWLFRRTLDQAGCKAKVDVAEMDSYPYMLGVLAPDTVEMGTVKAKWRISSTPANRIDAIIERVGGMFPGVVAARSPLESGFNLGGIFHIGGILTNVGRVESEGKYNFYAANMTPSVCNFIEDLDRERMEIARAYSIHMDDVRTWLAVTYGLKHESLRDSLQEMAHTHYEHAPAPKSLKHRYLVQDIGCDLVGAVSFARAAGVRTPISDAAITLAGSLTRRDFMAEGRNLRRLGLEGLTPAQINERLSA